MHTTSEPRSARSRAALTRWGLIASMALLTPRPSIAAMHVAAVRFTGDSTLHGFAGTGTSEAFDAVIRIGDDGTARLTARVAVPVASLDTGNESRDRNMMKMFESVAHPAVEGTLVDTPLPSDGDLTVPMTLRIHGTEHPVDAVLSRATRDGDTITLRLAFDVSLRQYGLKPPSVMGVIRVADTVRVECDVRPVTKEDRP